MLARGWRTGPSAAALVGVRACTSLPATVAQPPAERREGGKRTSRTDDDDGAGGLGGRTAEKKQRTGPQIKFKRKAPWGQQQLRDAWSQDAMATHDGEGFSKRLDSEYRYHPEAHLRRWIGWVMKGFLPAVVVSITVAYYIVAGDFIWRAGEFQQMLNMLRTMDTSPRSKLYYIRSFEKEI